MSELRAPSTSRGAVATTDAGLAGHSGRAGVQRRDAGARRGLVDERAQVELGRVVRASLQKGQVANRDLSVGKRRVFLSERGCWPAARRSAS